MKKILVLIVSMTMVLSLFLTACSKPQQAEQPKPSEPKPTTGGQVVIAQVSEPGNLNTVIWPTTSDTNITSMIYNCLVVPNEKLEMVGDLAESWTLSPDGKTYTFKLKQNVKWHDGVPFTAKDVAFTFKSLADPRYDAGSTSRVTPIVSAEEFRAGKAKDIEGIKVIDDNTISFTTKEPHAPFLSNLYIGILPEHILKDVSPAEWAKHTSNRAPIGTGPFKFVKWEAGQYIELAANKEYFGGAPKLDKIVVRFGDANTMLASFMNKEINIVPVPTAEVDSVKSESVDIKLADQLSVYYVGFNLRNENFKDLKVRQALAHAINKELLVSSILGEYGEICEDVFPNSHWSHSPNVTKFPYDKDQAKKLLEEAGYKQNANGIYAKNGKEFKFTLEVPTGNKEREKTGVLLKQAWEEIGVKVEIRQLDFATLVTKLLPKTKDGKQREVKAEDFDAYILGFGVEADPDEYRPYFHTSFMPPNGYNFCGYSDPEMDKLLDQQYKETNAQNRQKLFWQIGEKLSAEQPWIPIYGQKMIFAADKKVKNFNPDFRGVTFNARLWELEQ